jgi:hypothetical protein
MSNAAIEARTAWMVRLKWVCHRIELDEQQIAKRRKARARKAAAGVGQRRTDKGQLIPDELAATSADRPTDSRQPTTHEDEDELRVWTQLVDFFRADGARVRFRVKYLANGYLTISDARDQNAGTAGTTGIWGTLPTARAPRPRSMTPTAFLREASRFIGTRKAEELVRYLVGQTSA